MYIGLNAASTAHRALVTERFSEDRRAAATSAQEGAMLVGALAGTVIGGALIDSSAAALFVVWALLLPLLALPTLAWQRTSAPARAAAPAAPQGSAVKLLLEVLHRDGARQVLVAQVLWVASYTALTPFMVLYAEEVLDLRAAAAGLLLAGFGIVTGAGMVWGGRLPAERLRRTLLAGVALLGGGLLTAMAASNVAQAALPFAAAALGAGLVSAVGFPYFSRFVPDGRGGPLRRRLLLRARHRDDGGAAGGRAADRGHRLLPRAAAMGAVGLAGLVPLARAERRRDAVTRTAPALPPDRAARGGDPRLSLRPRGRGRRRRAAPRRAPSWSSTTARRPRSPPSSRRRPATTACGSCAWASTTARARRSPPASRRRSRAAPTR